MLSAAMVRPAFHPARSEAGIRLLMLRRAIADRRFRGLERDAIVRLPRARCASSARPVCARLLQTAFAAFGCQRDDSGNAEFGRFLDGPFKPIEFDQGGIKNYGCQLRRGFHFLEDCKLHQRLARGSRLRPARRFCESVISNFCPASTRSTRVR